MDVCKARRRDAVQVLKMLEKKVNKPAADWSDDDERRVQFVRVQACLEGLRKALAILDAYERIAARACKKNCPSLVNSPRLQSLQEAEPMSYVDAYMMFDSSVASSDPPACSQICVEVTALLLQVQTAREQEHGQQKDSSDVWTWLMQTMCCVSRGDTWDHDMAVENCMAYLERQVYNSKRGDVLCCAPADMSVDVVYFFHSPGTKERGAPVARGDKVLLQGRRGGWVFNKEGWLPLWHPITCRPQEANVLFAFDYHSNTFDDEDSDDGCMTEATATKQDAVFDEPVVEPKVSPRTMAHKHNNLMFSRSGNR